MPKVGLCFALVGFLGTPAVALECRQDSSGGIDVAMNVPHPDQMALVLPNSEWLYIQGPLAKEPPFSAHGFPALSSWKITSGTRATAWRDGRPSQVFALSVPGAYELVVSDNLETEQDNALSFVCKFTYEPST